MLQMVPHVAEETGGARRMPSFHRRRLSGILQRGEDLPCVARRRAWLLIPGVARSARLASSTGSIRVLTRVVNYLVWLGLAVVVVAIAAVTGIKPKGTRSVSHTRMMGMGRLALLAIVIIFVYLAFRARNG
jgi:hypothetical protein